MFQLIKYLVLFAILIVLLFYRCDHDRTNTDSLTGLKNYSDQFYPIYDTIPMFEMRMGGFPFPPDSLNELVKTHTLTPEFKEIIVLLFLKFYYAQRKSYGLGYDFRQNFHDALFRKNYFEHAMCEIAPEKCNGDFVNASIAIDIVEENKQYLNNKEIKLVYDLLLDYDKSRAQ